MNFVTRADWGARKPNGSGNAIGLVILGTAIHWEGPEMGSRPHSKCDDLVRSIQDFHMDSRGWADIAYNLMVCEHGYVYEGRGVRRGSAANGTTQANLSYLAVCALVGKGDKQTQALLDGLSRAVSLCRGAGAGKKVVGHRDLFGTECPGDALYAHLSAIAAGADGTTKAPADKPAPVHTVPTTKAPAFPLAKGSYFGPRTGPAQSVSGYYGHSADLKAWQTQMAKRGWKLTADGHYGDQTEKVVTDFQREKHLTVDGHIGPNTWAAAWNASIS